MKEIIGKWILNNGKIIADSNCKIIESMIQQELTKIESSDEGWKVKYRGNHNTIWELTYPESHLNGGGPPKLIQIE